MKKIIKLFSTSLLIFSTLGLNAFVNLAIASNDKPQASLTATVLPQSRPLKPFTLTDSKNHAFTEQQLKGHWTLIFFGFTNCPMICPTAMATLNQAYGKLVAAKQNPLPEVLFISVDPERDTLKRIDQYVIGFNPKFIGATGSKKELDNLTAQLNVLYMKIKPSNANAKNQEDYSIDHSGTILLINPEGSLHAIFSMPHNADAIAKDFQTISTNYKS